MSCAATSGTTTTTSSITTTTAATTTTAGCTSCTANQIVFTPADPTKAGSIPATFTGPTTDAATGCLVLEAVCTATAPLIAFMQFNINEGGPLENAGMTTVVTAPLNCINGQWYYTEGGVTRAINEVNCSEAMANAGKKKKK